MGTSLRALAAGISLVLLSACGTVPASTAPSSTSSAAPSGPASGPSSRIPAPAPAPSPTGPRHDLIKDVQFSTLPWFDVIANVDVPLKNGTYTSGDRTWTQQGRFAYADANGDGELDALVQIDVVRNGKTRSFLYLWLWDATKKAPVQWRDPVGFYDRCGTELDGVRAGAHGGFDVEERWRDPQKDSCDAAAPRKLTRTVVVSNGSLMLVAPVQAYGGVCYPSSAEGSVYKSKKQVYLAPTAKSPIVTNQEQVFYEVPSTLERDWPAGWHQVSWIDDTIKKNQWFWGICGFVWTA